MALFLMISSGLFGAFSNLCLRWIIGDRGKSTYTFFVFQLLLTSLVVILLYPVRSGMYDWNLEVILFGVLAGVLIGGMKLMIEKALKTGPSGLTFSAINSASVLPAIILLVTVGSINDFNLTLFEFLGISLVVIGLLWSGWKPGEIQNLRLWLGFTGLAFVFYLGFLLITEVRSLVIQKYISDGIFEGINAEKLTSQWFVPIVFLTATAFHAGRYVKRECQIPKKGDVLWGIYGGLFNGISMFSFMYGVECASPSDCRYIFSLSAISLIFACNLWGKLLYEESINWRATSLCLLGIFLSAR